MERQPHDPRGGERPELRIAPETEESTDERAIREGIEAGAIKYGHEDIRDVLERASARHRAPSRGAVSVRQ